MNFQEWPSKGGIQFSEYRTQYRPELPMVLDNFNLEVQEKEKVGIVGRTGAGTTLLKRHPLCMIEYLPG